MRTTRLFVILLTFDSALCLNQSDGYNIGVILGSILAALAAIAIGAFIFYVCCLRNWLAPGAGIGYVRHDIYGPKKPQLGAKGGYDNRGAVVSPKKEIPRPPVLQPRDRYKPDYSSEEYERRDPRPDNGGGMVSIVGGRTTIPPTALRYSDSSNLGGGGTVPAVVLSSSEGEASRGRNLSSAYSSESELKGGRSAFESRVYHHRQETTYTRSQPATTAAARSSPKPLSAAYLGTGV